MNTIIVSLCCAFLMAPFLLFAQVDDTIPTIEQGAETFSERCTLCHGGQAMGEGKLALKIKDYPNTNLMINLKSSNIEHIKNVIIYGGILQDVSSYMPPFGNELTWTEIESLSMFLDKTRTEPTIHLAMLKSINDKQSKNMNLGREIFESRCVLCHGAQGIGNGRMSKIIKSPPPFNLTKSVMPKAYLSAIIKNGGEPMGRSPQMPPWIDQLSPSEVEAVTDYVISFRQ